MTIQVQDYMSTNDGLFRGFLSHVRAGKLVWAVDFSINVRRKPIF